MEPNGFQNVDYQNEKETLQGFSSCTSSVTLAQVQMTSQMTSQCPQNLDYVDDEIFNELFPQKENQIGKSNLHLLKCLFAYDPEITSKRQSFDDLGSWPEDHPRE